VKISDFSSFSACNAGRGRYSTRHHVGWGTRISCAGHH